MTTIMLNVCGLSETDQHWKAYPEGTSPSNAGLRTLTTSGVKLVRTSASPSGSRLTAPYRQLRALQARQSQGMQNIGFCKCSDAGQTSDAADASVQRELTK